MNKKRRDNDTFLISSSNNNCGQRWSAILKTVEENFACGLRHKKHVFLKKYGTGTYDFFAFDGLSISIIDVSLKQDLEITKIDVSDSLEMSFLIEGEQFIKLRSLKKNYTYESQECYLIYISKNLLSLNFLKEKHFKEVRIRMNKNFILKHNLDTSLDIKNQYGIQNIKNNFTVPICIETQKLLSELVNDNKKGILKRLFLESKILNLLALQIETKSKPLLKSIYSDKKILKKIHEIETIITRNLSIQYTIQDLAKKAGLSDSMLKKEFKRIFGKTIFEYTLINRIKKAKKLLNFSNKPIYEISELVGYKNATHFSAAFKKIEKVSPKKYRKKKKKKNIK